jgi:hypothetical protein
MYGRKYLRLAPMLYLAFFVGWVITPRLKDSPAWPATNQLFYKCDEYWWAQILFIGNMVPFFVEVTCGCFYWAWIVYCDMQLYLLIPIYVLIFKKSRTAGILTQIFLSAFSLIL